MQKDVLNDVNIQSEKVLMTPAELKALYPVSEAAHAYISQARSTIANIIQQRDPRLLVICGPCSIHDVEAAKDYANRLKKLHDQYADSLYIVMRVYFEKPRTTVGWKGFINDPNLDGTFDLELGLKKARELLVWLAELQLPLATEALDPISPQYMADLFSWSAIGARTTESQTHREMASGLSMPVGFKNGTDGNLDTAINALQAASSSHSFMGINQQGQVALLHTHGNPDGHVILRGASTPTMIPSTWRWPNRRWLRPAYRPAWWWIAVMAIPARIIGCSLWWRLMCCIRSRMVTAPSWVSCWSPISVRVTSPANNPSATCSTVFPSPMPVSTGKPRRPCWHTAIASWVMRSRLDCQPDDPA